VAGFFTTVVKDADFTALLIKQLGLTTVVLVPQEMPAGYILANLNR
jgi:hypothetical protein